VELLKNVNLPKRYRDQLSEVTDTIINDAGISTEKHISTFLADALQKIAWREQARQEKEREEGNEV
jgi:hypothetical protein